MDLPAPSVLFSLDPEWAEAILEGRKPFEYRRQPPASMPPYEALLYATDPVKAIVGRATIDFLVDGTATAIIDATIEDVPHDREDLRAYFDGAADPSALHIGDAVSYSDPISLSRLRDDLGEFHPPQNFRYIEPDDPLLEWFQSA